MFSNITPVVRNLIILNVVMYIGTVFLAPQLYYDFSLWFFKHPEFDFWQIFSHMFMHDSRSFMHILFNMYGLLLFGPLLERWMGSNRFIFFYLASGIGAYLLTTGIDYFQYVQTVAELESKGYSANEIPNILFTKTSLAVPMVGASGCLFGVLAGFAYLYPNLKLQLLFIPVPIAAKWLIGAYVAYETLATIGIINLQDNIGHAAHLGGAIFGFIMVWYWKRNDYDQYRIDN
ncbi:rhomboid family intramembrane serine protease [Nonlabens ponticola]|uniref:Rhomboid family intramembrane serine protease n=1 Tax=Nonlabens ponticola TaxID=2496866 RepID=A0A3S9MXK1_9FLAO|nr:rhomboid family intramembrane serine protease [Nonlabens ponticola]AZQ43971.1 rhomboid family intramembrane serine protease [Nonlabens ponticola]